MLTEQRPQAIIERLTSELEAIHVAVEDLSARHADHLGAKGGGGHFRVCVVCERFVGLVPIKAHRLVYAALGEMMVHDIHALQLLTLTPEQWAASQPPA